MILILALPQPDIAQHPTSDIASEQLNSILLCLSLAHHYLCPSIANISLVRLKLSTTWVGRGCAGDGYVGHHLNSSSLFSSCPFHFAHHYPCLATTCVSSLSLLWTITTISNAHNLNWFRLGMKKMKKNCLINSYLSSSYPKPSAFPSSSPSLPCNILFLLFLYFEHSLSTAARTRWTGIGWGWRW